MDVRGFFIMLIYFFKLRKLYYHFGEFSTLRKHRIGNLHVTFDQKQNDKERQERRVQMDVHYT